MKAKTSLSQQEGGVPVKPCSEELLDRAIAATVAAIEIYNKPNFRYRAETFCILAINGWELLLKAKRVCDNDDNIESLYETKQGKTKLTRSGNPLTHSIDYLAKKLGEQGQLDPLAIKNINVLLELRNSSIHFYHPSRTELATQLQQIGFASIKNFALATKDWFNRNLSEFNFYLMPLSFVDLPQQTSAMILNQEENNFLEYLKQLEAGAGETGSEYAVTIKVDVAFTRSKAKDATAVRITNNPEAPEVRLTEEQIREKYPWDYDKLKTECRNRYTDFKLNKRYHHIRKSLSADRKFCFIRYLDPGNPKSSTKPFFNSNILQEMDRHYSRK